MENKKILILIINLYTNSIFLLKLYIILENADYIKMNENQLIIEPILQSIGRDIYVNNNWDTSYDV